MNDQTILKFLAMSGNTNMHDYLEERLRGVGSESTGLFCQSEASANKEGDGGRSQGSCAHFAGEAEASITRALRNIGAAAVAAECKAEEYENKRGYSRLACGKKGEAGGLWKASEIIVRALPRAESERD